MASRSPPSREPGLRGGQQLTQTGEGREAQICLARVSTLYDKAHRWEETPFPGGTIPRPRTPNLLMVALTPKARRASWLSSQPVSHYPLTETICWPVQF